MPGVCIRTQARILTEVSGKDFATAGHLASYAGLAPVLWRPGTSILGGHASRKGAALSIARHPKGTYLAARYERIVVRRGKMKAIVATEHSILTAVWHMLAEGECYHDPGSDFFTQKDPTRTRNNAVRRLRELGYNVTLSTREAA